MTTTPQDLSALKDRLESIPDKGKSAMLGMAFPTAAMVELWMLRYIAREDAPALLARVEAAEKVIAEVRELHQPKKITQYNIPVFDVYDSPTVVHNGCTCGSYYYPCPSIKPLNDWS